MSDELDYRWRSVKDYGQPDAKTCPWGYRWRNGKATGMASEVWSPLPNVVEWQPLPPPCDKVMPSPEPEPKWRLDPCNGMIFPSFGIDDDELERAVAILNAVDRGETVGRVRPWQEAPDDDTEVLRWCDKRWAWSLGRIVLYHRSPWMAQPAPPAVDPSDHRKQEAEG